MIALNDSEIHDWSNKINDYNINRGYTFTILPRYINTSSHPAMTISTQRIESWGSPTNNTYENLRRNDENELIIEYSNNFSIIEDKDEDFKIILDKLRKNEIGNTAIIGDKSFDISLKNYVKESKEIHSVNNKNYVRYNFSSKDSVFNIIAQFWIIETALKLTLRESKFKINDIVSLLNDRSEDYLIIDQLVDNSFNVVKIIEITDNIITYSHNTTNFLERQITWSRTNRIDDIINN